MMLVLVWVFKCHYNGTIQISSKEICNYFRWVDPGVNKHYKNTQLKLKKSDGVELVIVQKELTRMKEKLAQTEVELQNHT